MQLLANAPELLKDRLQMVLFAFTRFAILNAVEGHI